MSMQKLLILLIVMIYPTRPLEGALQIKLLVFTNGGGGKASGGSSLAAALTVKACYYKHR